MRSRGCRRRPAQKTQRRLESNGFKKTWKAPKFLGYVKGTIHYMNYVKFPKDGMGFLKQSDSKEWVFQSFSDSGCAGDCTTR